MSRLLFLVAACLFLASTALSAQSQWSAEGPVPRSVWIGAEISMFNPDYGCSNASPFTCGSNQLLGLAPFVDANHLIFQRLGVEGKAQFLHWRGPGNGLTEASYLAGPKFGLWRFRRSALFSGKVLVGEGNITLPSHGAGDGYHFAFAPGFMADIKLNERVFARAEYEYQIWPFFKSYPTATTTGTGGLTPNGFSFGIGYSFQR